MTKEWEKVKEALKKKPTPEAMKEAAKAFDEYAKAKGKGSKPMLVSLGYNKPYPTAIEVKDIAQELERNPEFFKFMSKVVTEGK